MNNTQDYHINYAGSLFAGEPNTQKTIEEIFDLFPKHIPEDFTFCKKRGNRWFFWGNFQDLSNVFDIDIFVPSLARKAQRVIREAKEAVK